MGEEHCELLCLNIDHAEKLRDKAPAEEALGGLAAEMKALGDPTRVLLAHALGEAGELCVCDLSWVVSRTDKLVSHHLRLMRQAGLLGSRKDGKMVLYSLTERGARLLSVLAEEGVPA